MTRTKRKPTVCQACGFPSYNGRVCKSCRAYYGGDVKNCVEAAALAKRLEGLTYDEAVAALCELFDVVVPDLPRYNTPWSVPAIGAADTKGGEHA
jgi:hypothetical protein